MHTNKQINKMTTNHIGCECYIVLKPRSLATMNINAYIKVSQWNSI